MCETPAVATELDPVPRWQRVVGSWWVLAAVVLGVFVLSPVRDATVNDPAFAPLTAHSLVHGGTVVLDGVGAEQLIGHPVVVSDGSLDPGFVVSSVGGEGWDRLQAAVDDPDVDVVDYFPWTSSLAAVPGIVAVDAWAAVTGGRDSGELLADGDFTLVHTVSASLVTLGAVLVLRAIGLVVLTGAPGRRRVLANGVALVFALGTSAWSTASRALWQHTPSLLLLALALWCAVRIDRAEPSQGSRPLDPWVVALGAAAVGATVVRPTNLAFAAIIGIWVLVRRRDFVVPTLCSAALGGAATAAAFVGASMIVLGQPVPDYYSAGRLELGGWFAEAVAANWISPSRGLLVASPVVLLAVPGAIVAWRDPARRSLVVALGASVAAVTVSISAFPQWWAGHAFGPRFMTEAVPQLFVLALPAFDRALDLAGLRVGAPRRARSVAAAVAVVALAAWSIGFHAVGAIAGASGCWNVYPVDIDADPGRVWSVTDAQVLEPVHRQLDAERRAAQDATCSGDRSAPVG